MVLTLLLTQALLWPVVDLTALMRKLVWFGALPAASPMGGSLLG